MAGKIYGLEGVFSRTLTFSGLENKLSIKIFELKKLVLFF